MQGITSNYSIANEKYYKLAEKSKLLSPLRAPPNIKPACKSNFDVERLEMVL